ncbi:MAG: hypothetical protein ACOZAR_02190 [Patescibacteria group bacterium]
MSNRKLIFAFIGFSFVILIAAILVAREKSPSVKENTIEKKVVGFIDQLQEDRLVVDDGKYLYEFKNWKDSDILLANQAMQAEKVDWNILKEYAPLEQKIEVNFTQKEDESEVLEIIISLNKAWTGRLKEIDLEKKTLSLQGDNKILVFANDKVKGIDLKSGDEISIWVDYDRVIKKFIISKIQLNQ